MARRLPFSAMPLIGRFTQVMFTVVLDSALCKHGNSIPAANE